MRLPIAAALAAAGLWAQEPQEVRSAWQGRELVYLHSGSEPAGARPLLVFLHDQAAGDIEVAREAWKRWQPSVTGQGWRLLVPWTGGGAPAWTDAGVKALEATVRDFMQRAAVDPERVYLSGGGEGASQVFYVVSRMPDLWAAAMAAEGNPKIAIETNRLFAANTSLVPLLWVVNSSHQSFAEPLRKRLLAAGFNLHAPPSEALTTAEAFAWLSRHRRDPSPPKIDCETGNLGFPRCYWIEIVRFDPALRNDALPSSRVQPGSGAYLGLGGFGFDPNEAGPGVLVGWLPPNYNGQLRLQDRIVSVGGRSIANGRDYLEFMEQQREEKPAAVVIQRGQQRLRLETQILLAKREENLTARIQGEFLPETRELQLISRAVAEVRVQIPAGWTPVRLNWNGSDVGELKEPGCWHVSAPALVKRCLP